MKPVVKTVGMELGKYAIGALITYFQDKKPVRTWIAKRRAAKKK